MSSDGAPPPTPPQPPQAGPSSQPSQPNQPAEAGPSSLPPSQQAEAEAGPSTPPPSHSRIPSIEIHDHDNATPPPAHTTPATTPAHTPITSPSRNQTLLATLQLAFPASNPHTTQRRSAFISYMYQTAIPDAMLRTRRKALEDQGLLPGTLPLWPYAPYTETGSVPPRTGPRTTPFSRVEVEAIAQPGNAPYFWGLGNPVIPNLEPAVAAIVNGNANSDSVRPLSLLEELRADSTPEPALDLNALEVQYPLPEGGIGPVPRPIGWERGYGRRNQPVRRLGRFSRLQFGNPRDLDVVFRDRFGVAVVPALRATGSPFASVEDAFAADEVRAVWYGPSQPPRDYKAVNDDFMDEMDSTVFGFE